MSRGGYSTLTVSEVAAELRSHPNFIRQLISEKKLDAWKHGPHWRIEASALDDYKQRQRVGRPQMSRLRALEGGAAE